MAESVTLLPEHIGSTGVADTVGGVFTLAVTCTRSEEQPAAFNAATQYWVVAERLGVVNVLPVPATVCVLALVYQL